jgi:F0F1-type ATP synthase assembly protein I
MVTRGEILWLGIASGVTGGLIGGMMLGIGMDLVVNGQPLGLIPVCIGGPCSGLIGWLLARRLAAQIKDLG